MGTGSGRIGQVRWSYQYLTGKNNWEEERTELVEQLDEKER